MEFVVFTCQDYLHIYNLKQRSGENTLFLILQPKDIKYTNSWASIIINIKIHAKCISRNNSYLYSLVPFN